MNLTITFSPMTTKTHHLYPGTIVLQKRHIHRTYPLFLLRCVLCLLLVTYVGAAFASTPAGENYWLAQGSASIIINGYLRTDSSQTNTFCGALYDGNGVKVDSAVASGNSIRFLNVPTEVFLRPSSAAPEGFRLEQNFPNPFNPSTRIQFHIPVAGFVSLQIFDVLGRTITSYSGFLEPGTHEFEWEAHVAAGAYFYRVIAGNYSETKKMIKIDGGGGGASSLRKLGSVTGNGEGQNANGSLHKLSLKSYAIRLFNLPQTDPQILDTVIQIAGLSSDTSIILYFRTGPKRSMLIPMPDSLKFSEGQFVLSAAAKIIVDPGSPELAAIGQYLADRLNPATGFGISVSASSGVPSKGSIVLTAVGGDATLGEEGYVLSITTDFVSLSAYRPAGIFRGVQTIRQLLPDAIESSTVQTASWQMPTAYIRDHPRFGWRGAMLDVARHFFTVANVKRHIDLLALYKINRLHLHLSDDEGWRIDIKSWPKLATIGGSTDYTHGVGGYYTQGEYSSIVAYAASRYITIVPEIDMPGHMGAALRSYPSLQSSGEININADTTYIFINDVVREVAALTPGPYFHVGGDEAQITGANYIRFVDSAQAIVMRNGKRMIGWADVAQSHLVSPSIAQHWFWTDPYAMIAVQKGGTVVMSPANKTYLDQKYNPSTPLGLTWAGYTEVDRAYNWNPATEQSGVNEGDLEGVEAPLWTETILTTANIDFMTFPRLLGHAEIGWSRVAGRYWDEYRVRLGYQGPRMTVMGINFYRSSLIPWK